MSDPETFTWYGEEGEPLRFADLSEAEQRVALIAAGGLLWNRSKKKLPAFAETSIADTDQEG